MQKPGRGRRSDVMSGDTGPSHSKPIGDDRNWNACQRDQNPGARTRIHEIAIENGQRKQGDERANAAAGFGHFEGRLREHDDVAFAEDGDSCQFKNGDPELRRQELELKRQWIEHDCRQRNHQQGERQREQQHSQPLPASQEQHNARDDPKSRHPHQKELHAGGSDKQEYKTAGHEDQPRVRGPTLRCHQAVPSHPDEVRRHRDNEEAMGIIRVSRPVFPQVNENLAIEQQESGDYGAERQRQRPLPIRGHRAGKQQRAFQPLQFGDGVNAAVFQ